MKTIKHEEAQLLVRAAITEIELQQIEKGNKEFKMAYIVGVLTIHLIDAISGDSEAVINRLKRTITLNTPKR